MPDKNPELLPCATLPTLEAVQRNISDRYSRQREELLKRAADLHETETAFLKDVGACVVEYMRTGIGRNHYFDIRDNSRRYWSGDVASRTRTHFTWRAFYRELAQDLGRPFVYLSNNLLYIPKRRYTEPLIGNLLLVAARCDQSYYRRLAPLHRSYDEVGVSYVNNTREWCFEFRGDNAKKLLDAWLQQCATDPVFKKILKIV